MEVYIFFCKIHLRHHISSFFGNIRATMDSTKVFNLCIYSSPKTLAAGECRPPKQMTRACARAYALLRSSNAYIYTSSIVEYVIKGLLSLQEKVKQREEKKMHVRRKEVRGTSTGTCLHAMY